MNGFLATDLQAEAAVDAGDAVEFDPAVLSSYQGGALESFEAVPAADAGAHSGAVDRRGRALTDTRAAARAFGVINHITLLRFRNRSGWAIDHASVAFAASIFIDHRQQGFVHLSAFHLRKALVR